MTTVVETSPTKVGHEREQDEVMAKAKSENFPVALRLLPARLRQDLLAIYGFARFVDDVGDTYEGERLERLAWVESELRRASQASATHPVFVQLGATMRSHELPLTPFLDLIEANRQDQAVTRYASIAELEQYCSLSANPVGRLVLLVLGKESEQNNELSDSICTGLQIVEHLQDVGEDYASGRIYLPLEDLSLFKVDEHELGRASAGPGLRRLIAFEAARTRIYFDNGNALIGRLSGFARICIAGFYGGGLAQLDALEAASFDPLAHVVKASKASVLTHSLRSLVQPRGRR